jgi:hypothetical protein
LLLLLVQLRECLRMSCKHLAEAIQAAAFILIKRVCYCLCSQGIIVILNQHLVGMMMPHGRACWQRPCVACCCSGRCLALLLALQVLQVLSSSSCICSGSTCGCLTGSM